MAGWGGSTLAVYGNVVFAANTARNGGAVSFPLADGFCLPVLVFCGTAARLVPLAEVIGQGPSEGLMAELQSRGLMSTQHLTFA